MEIIALLVKLRAEKRRYNHADVSEIDTSCVIHHFIVEMYIMRYQ